MSQFTAAQFLILEPIQSRCAIVKYTRLADEDVRKRVIQVCGYENVEYVEEGIDAIVNTAQGDMRQVCELAPPPLVSVGFFFRLSTICSVLLLVMA